MKSNNLQLVAFLNSDINTRNNSMPKEMLMSSGVANGYVAIPPEHPLFGKSMSDSEIEKLRVHGGVTFTGSFYECQEHFSSMRFLTPGIQPAPNWWVIGFDTCHWNDSPETCPLAYVVAETENLKRQLEVLCITK